MKSNGRPTRKKWQSGWTHSGLSLIELLVVVGIIGVLVAVLFPVMQNFANESRAAKCFSSLQQLYVGAVAFSMDNHDAMPYTTYNPDTGEFIFWSDRACDYALQNTATDIRAITCPDSPFANGKNVVSSMRVPLANYGMNGYLGNYLDNALTGTANSYGPPGWWPRGLRPPSFRDLASRSTTILYFDAGHYSPTQNSVKNPTPVWGYLPGYSANKSIASFYVANPKVTTDAHKGRHGGTICFIHADGSLGKMKVSEFVETDANWQVTFGP